jgi:hypothetical protein
MKKIDLLLLLLLLVIIIQVILYFEMNKSDIEAFTRIRFFDKMNTVKFVKEDKDDYLKSLSPFDIQAQRSKSVKDYENKIIAAADSFTPDEKRRLEKACRKVDEILKKINIPGFDGKKAASLDWNIALTRGNNYEEGAPHTRLNVIFLNDLHPLSYDDKQLKKTLLHEKVHVYERLYPNDIDIWLKDNGFHKYKKWDDYKIARSNPDINEWSYKNKNGVEMVVLYNNKNPTSIHQVKYPKFNDPASEHPYETLAYTLEEYI